MLYTSVEFEELVCYSQTVILVLLAIGYIINLRKGGNEPSQKVERKCPSCRYRIPDENVNYCAKCGELISHSVGLSMEK
jgi:rRNA maturation endonuclease Nob1